MNHVQLLGKIVEGPDMKGTTSVAFTLAIPRPSVQKGGSGADFVGVLLTGSKVNHVYENLMEGDIVGVTGRLRSGRSGAESWDVWVSVHDVWLVKDGTNVVA